MSTGPVVGNPTPDVSVVVVSAGRGPGPGRLLATLGSIDVPAGLAIELVLVDNGSERAFARLAGVGPPWTRVLLHEPRPGKARGLNAAIAAARGRILVFLDDDVVPEPHWLAALCRPILAGEADAVQGAVVVPADLVRPGMTGYHRSLLASTEEGYRVDRTPHLIGANAAISRDVFARVPEFAPELGPGALGFHEDTLFGSQLVEAGFRFVFEPAARVAHRFDRARLTRAAFLDRVRRDAACEVWVDHHWRHAPTGNLASEFRFRQRRLLKAWVLNLPHWGPARLRGEPPTHEELQAVLELARARARLRIAGTPRLFAPRGLVRRAAAVAD